MAAEVKLDPAWLDAVGVRRSRRSYDGQPLPDATSNALAAFAESFMPFPDARAVFVRQAPQALFAGIVGSYGGVSDAPSAFAFVGQTASRDTLEHVGYTGEALVLEATRLGCQTCWIGGLFSGGVAERLSGVHAGERVYAVSPVGFAPGTASTKERLLFGAGREKKRLPAGVIAPGSSDWPGWALAAVETARLAPSAMHGQPWRFRMEGDALIVSFDGAERPKISKRIDVGIAMLHAELGARSEGVTGTWTSLESPDVVRFDPS
ncbi:MAG: nitroreductase family protein [Coriobacteriia bacterium]